jgi:hypothetical protein
MEQRELEEIERFFAGLGHKTPLAYYGLPEDAPAADIEPAIKKRRTWAQGQQANPKYRQEALFLIKGNNMLRRLLLDERDEYVERFGEGNPRLTELNDFIRGQLADSGWNPSTEGAIRVVGRRLDVEDDLVETRIQAIARDLNVKREGDADLGDLGAIDAYALLVADSRASTAELEEAYRARYRWARSLRDHEKSGQVLAALDAAWRILQDPERREAYDRHLGEVGEATEEVEKGSRELGDLLRGAAVVEPDRSSAALLEAVRNSPRSSGNFPQPPPLSMPFPAAAEPVAALVPPAAPEIQGRTIGLASGPQMVRDRAPKLKVPAKLPVVLALPRSGFLNWNLRILNEGQGRMPGKVVSDVPWLVPSRDWLDPLAREQEIGVEVRGDLMGAPVAEGTLTVVTDHGQRVQLPIEARRATLTAPLLAALLALILVAGGGYGLSWWREASAPPPPVVLRLTVDPPAEAVLVDGARVGGGEAIEISPPTAGQPFRIRIEREGFRPHEELITLASSSLSRAVRMELADDMLWSGAEGEPAALPAESLEALSAATAAIRTCIGGGTGSLLVRASADEAGTVRGLELEGEGVDLKAARPCVGRVARTLNVGAPPVGGWSRGVVLLELGASP